MELIKWLLTFGPALKDIMPDLQLIFEAVQRIYGKLNPKPAGELAIAEGLSVAEQAELDKVLALLQPDGAQAALDIGFILAAIQFFRQNPELLDFIKGLFAKRS